MSNQINNNIQFTMEKSQTGLNKSNTKNWMDIYNKTNRPKRHVPLRQTTHGIV